MSKKGRVRKDGRESQRRWRGYVLPEWFEGTDQEWWRIYQKARLYKISFKECFDLLEANPNCNICNKSISGKNQHIDHCHESGELRGVLCHKCNTVLGLVDEDVNILNTMKSYLNEKG